MALGLVAGDAAQLSVAGVALGDIHLRFAWHAWHLAASTCVLRGRRSTWSHPFSFCVAGVAGVALGDIHLRFAWQVWHLVTFTFVLRGRCGTYGIVLALGRHTPSFTHAIFHTLSLSHTTVTHHLCHTPSFIHYRCQTPSFTHNLVTHTHTPSFTHHLSRYSDSYHVYSSALIAFGPRRNCRQQI